MASCRTQESKKKARRSINWKRIDWKIRLLFDFKNKRTRFKIRLLSRERRAFYFEIKTAKKDNPALLTNATIRVRQWSLETDFMGIK